MSELQNRKTENINCQNQAVFYTHGVIVWLAGMYDPGIIEGRYYGVCINILLFTVTQDTMDTHKC